VLEESELRRLSAPLTDTVGGSGIISGLPLFNSAPSTRVKGETNHLHKHYSLERLAQPEKKSSSTLVSRVAGRDAHKFRNQYLPFSTTSAFSSGATALALTAASGTDRCRLADFFLEGDLIAETLAEG